MSLYSKNIDNILDEYDANFDHYKSYKDRLVVILKELFNKTTIPIHSVSGSIMSRGELRSKLIAAGAIYNSLGDIHNLVSLTVVTYFYDDINLSLSLIGKEFFVEEIALSELEEEAQKHFGILIKRHSLMLPDSKNGRVENERFSSVRAELKVRTSLQDSWFLVKNVFNDIADRDNLTISEIDQLAQVSYLLKAADTELCRIKTSLAEKKEQDKTANQNLELEEVQINNTEQETNES
ncbi:MAG: hypothetical protein HQL71_08225 [Magnetococcales bacterium]|nr:hypothetical protein [Magnetococcales bacterium]